MAKILIFENSSGMAHYTFKVCNGLASTSDDQYYYMTDAGFLYQRDLNKKIILDDSLSCFAEKRNKILWMYDRIKVVVRNIKHRNRFIQERNIDILNIQFTTPIIEQFFIKKLAKKIKIILTVHDVIPPVKSLYWSHKSLKKIYDNCHLLIVHSNENKQQLLSEFSIPESKIRVVHHGTDVNYKKIDKECCLEKIGIHNDGIPNFLFFGSIREQKGLDVLIKAVNKIQKPCRLIIAGAMPTGESFEKYDKLMNNKERFVKIIRFIEPELVDYIFQAADAIVNPYKYFFSQSGVFMECVKYRKPIVATDVSSFKSFIETYNIGIVVEPDSVESLKCGLEKYIGMTESEVSAMIDNLESAAKQNSWEFAAELYHKVFMEAYENA